MVEREGQLLHDAVGVVGAVGRHLRAGREARQAQVEVGAHRALDAHRGADVPLAEVAVVQGPVPGPRAISDCNVAGMLQMQWGSLRLTLSKHHAEQSGAGIPECLHECPT